MCLFWRIPSNTWEARKEKQMTEQTKVEYPAHVKGLADALCKEQTYEDWLILADALTEIGMPKAAEHCKEEAADFLDNNSWANAINCEVISSIIEEKKWLWESPKLNTTQRG